MTTSQNWPRSFASYTEKHNARRAAKKALGNPKATEGVDFTIEEEANGFFYRLAHADPSTPTEESTGEDPAAEVPSAAELELPAFMRNGHEAEPMAEEAAQEPAGEAAEGDGEGQEGEAAGAAPAAAGEAAPRVTTHDLGAGWFANFWENGGMTIRNPDLGLRIDLEAGSVATLRDAFRQARSTKPRAPKPAGDGGPSKREICEQLLTRPEGATTKELLEATGWPSISVPAQAKASGLTLRQKKDGRVTRYFGTKEAA